MGAYQGKNQYVEDIYTFERTDKVSGGDDGIDNVPIKNLTDRTTYLRSLALNSFLDIYGINPVGTFGIGFDLQESGDGVYDEVSGKWYYWLGSFPKSVAENSSPEDTGGIFDPESNPDGLWTEVIPVNQRQVDMVARAFRVKTEEVQFMKVGRPLDGFRVLYDLASQEAYRLPMGIPEGSTIVSLTAGGWFVHSNGGVDLSAYAVELEEYKYFTGGDFSTGFTLRQNHCIVMYDGVLYRWDGDFPKTVNANSTPEADGIGDGKWVPVKTGALYRYATIAQLDSVENALTTHINTVNTALTTRINEVESAAFVNALLF